MSDWNYQPKEGQQWSDVFPLCGGNNQSPIKIDEKTVKKAGRCAPLHFIDALKRPSGMTFQNTGHGFEGKLIFNDGIQPKILGGPLKEAYSLVSFHAHWNSEHSVNGSFHDAEYHFVFANDKHSSFEEASKQPQGLAVLAIFCKVPSQEPSPKRFKSIGQLYSNIASVQEYLSKTSIQKDPMALFNLVGSKTTLQIWSYGGSLTTPTCNETVIWLISKEVLSITRAEIATLKSLKDKDGKPLECNARPLQPLNDREVKSF